MGEPRKEILDKGLAKVMILKGKERMERGGWTQSTRGTTERVGVGDRMLIFSHPREVTEKSVRRGEDTCLMHFLKKDP